MSRPRAPLSLYTLTLGSCARRSGHCAGSSTAVAGPLRCVRQLCRRAGRDSRAQIASSSGSGLSLMLKPSARWYSSFVASAASMSSRTPCSRRRRRRCSRLSRKFLACASSTAPGTSGASSGRLSHASIASYAALPWRSAAAKSSLYPCATTIRACRLGRFARLRRSC